MTNAFNGTTTPLITRDNIDPANFSIRDGVLEIGVSSNPTNGIKQSANGLSYQKLVTSAKRETVGPTTYSVEHIFNGHIKINFNPTGNALTIAAVDGLLDTLEGVSGLSVDKGYENAEVVLGYPFNTTLLPDDPPVQVKYTVLGVLYVLEISTALLSDALGSYILILDSVSTDKLDGGFLPPKIGGFYYLNGKPYQTIYLDYTTIPSAAIIYAESSLTATGPLYDQFLIEIDKNTNRLIFDNLFGPGDFTYPVQDSKSEVFAFFDPVTNSIYVQKQLKRQKITLTETVSKCHLSFKPIDEVGNSIELVAVLTDATNSSAVVKTYSLTNLTLTGLEIAVTPTGTYTIDLTQGVVAGENNILRAYATGNNILISNWVTPPVGDSVAIVTAINYLTNALTDTLTLNAGEVANGIFVPEISGFVSGIGNVNAASINIVRLDITDQLTISTLSESIPEFVVGQFQLISQSPIAPYGFSEIDTRKECLFRASELNGTAKAFYWATIIIDDVGSPIVSLYKVPLTVEEIQTLENNNGYGNSTFNPVRGTLIVNTLLDQQVSLSQTQLGEPTV